MRCTGVDLMQECVKPDLERPFGVIVSFREVYSSQPRQEGPEVDSYTNRCISEVVGI